MVSHNGNIRHCARSALHPVGIPPNRGRHSALTRQFSLVGIPLTDQGRAVSRC